MDIDVTVYRLADDTRNKEIAEGLLLDPVLSVQVTNGVSSSQCASSAT
jgi:hypothetical protein